MRMKGCFKNIVRNFVSWPGEIEERLGRYFNTVSAENSMSGMTLMISRLSLGNTSLPTVNKLVK